MRSFLTAIALGCACLLAQAQTASHVYDLNGNLNDSVSGPALIANGGSLGANGYTFGKNQGLTLQPALGGVYTIDLSFHFDTAGGWQKIVDFSGLAADAGMYTLGTTWDFFPVAGAGVVTAGTDHRLTLTRDAASNVAVYADGALQFSFSDGAGYANFGSNAANFFIDDHATGQGEATSGYVDYIRTYDSALSAGQVASLGSTTAVPEPSEMALSLLGLLVVGTRLRRRSPLVRKDTQAV